MDTITTASSEDKQLYASALRKSHPPPSKIGNTLPKAYSLPAVQMAKNRQDFEEPRYAVPPPIEQPRDVGPEVHDFPTTIVAKRIFLTSVNQSRELRCAWVTLVLLLLLSTALLALGAYHVIEAHRDVEDAPNTFLSEPVAAAPAPAVSLYYEAVTILQLALIALFACFLGFAAYFPHGARQPAKMVFLIFASISIYLALNSIASISEEVAHKINAQKPNSAYRVAELCILPFVILCLMIAAYPACAAFIVHKFEKQTNRLLRILCFFGYLMALLIFLVHVHVCAVAVNRGYHATSVSRLSATVRLSYAVSALPVSLFGSLLILASFKEICRGARPIGVWSAVLASAAILVMYNATPLLAGLFQDVRGDTFDFIYLIQYVLHCSCIVAWTLVILLGAAYAYVR